MFARPLVYLVPAAAGALYAAVCLGLPINFHICLLLLSVFLAGAGLVIFRTRLFTVLSMLAAAALALSGLAAFNMIIVDPIRTLDGQSRIITATVMQDAAVYEKNQRAKLSIDRAVGLPRSFRTLCYLPLTDEPLLAGDRVAVQVQFYLPGQTEGFDRASYQAADGCFIASSYAKNEEGAPKKFSLLPTERQTLRFLPQRIARFCKESIQQALPERQAGLLNALLLGDKSGFDRDDALSLRIAGLSHLVAVSGLHVGFLVAFCYLLFGRKYGTVISIPIVLLFVPVAGATPSVIRAAVMYLITAGAFLCRREASGLNSLFTALALLLLMNPYAIASLSLQLSFMATLGLILLSGKIQRRLSQPFQNCGRLFKKVVAMGAGAISCSICAMLFTIPILLTSFGYVSVLSVFSNLLATGITSICFIAGFLLCLCARFLPIVVPALAKVEEALLGAMISIAEWVADLPFGLVSGQDGFFVAALLSAMGALWLWLLLGKQVKWKFVLPVVCVAVVTLTAAGVYDKQNHYAITFLPCGTGQAILVSDAAQQYTMLIDCAGDGGYHDAAASVQEWMRWHGVSEIDTLVLTAGDKGHARDLPALLNHTAVESIWMPAQCRETKHNKEILHLLAGASAMPIEEKTVLNAESVPITIFPIAEGKAGVLIGRQILVLHSPTQKQLSAFWQTGEQYTAPIIVLAQRNLSDTALLGETIRLTKAERLIIQAGSKEFLPAYEGIPTQSPYLTGELCIRYKKEEAQWQ